MPKKHDGAHGVGRSRGASVVSRGAPWVLMVLASLWLGCKQAESTPAPVDPLTAKRGRSLFQRGQGVRGRPLMGFLAPERVELSGEVSACARCHGPSGRGSREGGVDVPDITPGALGHSRARAVGALEDRARPAYTRATLLRAITEGISASGRELGVAMPRYALDEVEREELLAFLGQLGEHPDPGVSPASLTVGAALPLTGRRGPLGQEAAAVVRAVFADVNASGGIFRRKLELLVEDDAALYPVRSESPPNATTTPRLRERVNPAESEQEIARGSLPPTPDATTRVSERVSPTESARVAAGGPPHLVPDATTRLLDRGVLALVASMRRGPLPSDARLTEEGAPLVLPLALNGGTSDEDSPVFFLYPDEPALARLAVQSLATTRESELRRKPLVVVHTGGDEGQAWAQAVRAETTRRELRAPVELPLSDGPLPVEHWASAPPPAVLYAGTPEGLDTLLRALEAHAPTVRVLAPASLAIPEVVGASTGRIHFLYPAGLGERAPELKDFAAFMKRHGLAPGHTSFQFGAYAAARVLVEALTRAGAEVTRASLTQQLETLRDFDTGVSPPVTFGVNRRVGVQGGQLAALDPATNQLVPVSDWIPLTP
ncbi:ABC transporter substrate-binding protein [Myxococcus sp. AM011]|uniref:cytochrome c/ABC transporter substrate-binding protein n=1 Tax=Myxococcus sp. AM011 TaxID=2745200 RepID=UPI0015954CB5|nr:ABC transporter substrate-binding protein [Myxococcus sp. AM011]NVJ27095.1 ABC transporter substrate-binding protein [Myxococcus sp. AM011]